MAADYLKIGLSKVGMLSERRTFRLLDEHANAGLQPMLCIDFDHTGIHSGMMMPQYTAASLTVENQTLATPDSLHSLPTSAGQEDINANATTAARHLAQVLANLSRIIAIEMLTATQALELRMQLLPNAKMGIGTNAAFRKIRELVPFRTEDYPLSNDIEDLSQLVTSGELQSIVDEVITNVDPA
jgi:histidine ammonia-lyase